MMNQIRNNHHRPVATKFMNMKAESLPPTLDQDQLPAPRCPVGQPDCPALQEIAELRLALAELSQLVRTDTLTGIANYRFFIVALEQELERTRRSGQPTTLIMLDIDHFKQVNDQWGHEVGNQALIHIAELMQLSIRKLDIPCRYGGEEFAIILPNTDLAASIPVAQRLRRSIAETPLMVGEKQLQLTASLGIDSFATVEEVHAEELVKRADHYLYLAKNAGRNCVRHASLPPIDLVSAEERTALFNLFGSGNREEKVAAGKQDKKP
jgi:diguanylate cyclase (GGDEF)-like protein